MHIALGSQLECLPAPELYAIIVIMARKDLED